MDVTAIPSDWYKAGPGILDVFADFPFALPPPGKIANFDDPATNTLGIYVTCAICIPIILVAASGRLLAKLTVGSKRLNWADYIFICSLLITVVFLSLTLACASAHFVGRHVYDIKVKDLRVDQLLYVQISSTIWPIGVLFVKISILIMYIEVFGVQRWLRMTSYFAIVIMTIIHLFSALYYSIACRPRGGQSRYAYLKGSTSQQCVEVFKLLVMQSAVHVFEDLFLMILPLPCVWALKMPLKQKIGLSAIFLFGVCGVTASVISLYYRIELLKSKDTTWEGVYTVFMGIWEMMVCIVLVCLPQLIVLGKQWPTVVKTITSHTQSNRSHHRSSLSFDHQGFQRTHSDHSQSRPRFWRLEQLSRFRLWQRVPPCDQEKSTAYHESDQDQSLYHRQHHVKNSYDVQISSVSTPDLSSSRGGDRSSPWDASAFDPSGARRKVTRTWSCYGGAAVGTDHSKPRETGTDIEMGKVTTMSAHVQNTSKTAGSIQKQTDFTVHVIEDDGSNFGRGPS